MLQINNLYVLKFKLEIIIHILEIIVGTYFKLIGISRYQNPTQTAVTWRFVFDNHAGDTASEKLITILGKVILKSC